mgnify:FL=1
MGTRFCGCTIAESIEKVGVELHLVGLKRGRKECLLMAYISSSTDTSEEALFMDWPEHFNDEDSDSFEGD